MKKRAVKNSDYYRPIARLVMEARRRRRKNGLTQKELAERIGTNQGVIARFENIGRIPTYDFLIRLCRTLGTELFMSVNGEYTVVVPDELREVVDKISMDRNEDRSVFLVNLIIDSLNELNERICVGDIENPECNSGKKMLMEKLSNSKKDIVKVDLSSPKTVDNDSILESIKTSLYFGNSKIAKFKVENPGFQTRNERTKTEIQDSKFCTEIFYEEEEEGINECAAMMK